MCVPEVHRDFNSIGPRAILGGVLQASDILGFWFSGLGAWIYQSRRINWTPSIKPSLLQPTRVADDFITVR